ncbi:hypothetical protein K457DRAFT_22641 [Linnemannia elongata AG-77]|uniref:Uncharacterized protein n=1 Tax=Linnemannia elongata AG-77 TaxID=1314771 RepID=A0A197JNB4_9FUNG|nr:hypothetical protein K457DRAFT_22641 [Linnemannia elongata AG-77]
MRLITLLGACALVALSTVRAQDANPAAAAAAAVPAAAEDNLVISAEGVKKDIDPSYYPSLKELEQRISSYNAYVTKKDAADKKDKKPVADPVEKKKEGKDKEEKKEEKDKKEKEKKGDEKKAPAAPAEKKEKTQQKAFKAADAEKKHAKKVSATHHSDEKDHHHQEKKEQQHHKVKKVQELSQHQKDHKFQALNNGGHHHHHHHHGHHGHHHHGHHGHHHHHHHPHHKGHHKKHGHKKHHHKKHHHDCVVYETITVVPTCPPAPTVDLLGGGGGRDIPDYTTLPDMPMDPSLDPFNGDIFDFPNTSEPSIMDEDGPHDSILDDNDDDDDEEADDDSSIGEHAVEGSGSVDDAPVIGDRYPFPGDNTPIDIIPSGLGLGDLNSPELVDAPGLADNNDASGEDDSDLYYGEPYEVEDGEVAEDEEDVDDDDIVGHDGAGTKQEHDKHHKRDQYQPQQGQAEERYQFLRRH